MDLERQKTVETSTYGSELVAASRNRSYHDAYKIAPTRRTP
jgi:hypothetical protein